MAIPRTAVVATIISLLLLLIIQSLYLAYDEDSFRQRNLRWLWSSSKDDDLKSLEVGDEYLLGVGKADITGYVRS